MEELYIKVDGEYKQIIPFIYIDIGHSHIEYINVALKDDYDELVESCDIIYDLDVLFCTRDELKEALRYD